MAQDWVLGLLGAALGAGLTTIVLWRWVRDGIAVRGAAAAHLERAKAHLDRAGEYLARVQAQDAALVRRDVMREVQGVISYPGQVVYVDEVRPGESIWAAAERERQEKLRKTADSGANPGKTALEDARGDVFEGDRGVGDGANGAYPCPGLDDEWCPGCRAFHPPNETGMLEQCEAWTAPSLDDAPVYRTMEEVEAVHGPVVETFYESGRTADFSKLTELAKAAGEAQYPTPESFDRANELIVDRPRSSRTVDVEVVMGEPTGHCAGCGKLLGGNNHQKGCKYCVPMAFGNEVTAPGGTPFAEWPALPGEVAHIQCGLCGRHHEGSPCEVKPC